MLNFSFAVPKNDNSVAECYFWRGGVPAAIRRRGKIELLWPEEAICSSRRKVKDV